MASKIWVPHHFNKDKTITFGAQCSKLHEEDHKMSLKGPEKAGKWILGSIIFSKLLFPKPRMMFYTQ